VFEGNVVEVLCEEENQLSVNFRYPGTAYPGTAYPGTAYPGTAYPGTVEPLSGDRGTLIRGPWNTCFLLCNGISREKLTRSPVKGTSTHHRTTGTTLCYLPPPPTRTQHGEQACAHTHRANTHRANTIQYFVTRHFVHPRKVSRVNE